jgi:hypothetical protein
MNALQVETAIRRHTRGVTLIPEASVRYSKGMAEGWGGKSYERFGDYFADFMMVSDSNYATELEVKVSLADWRVDLQKPKWTGEAFPKWITRFIYVVPVELGIPSWVPEVAGIWHVKQGFIRVGGVLCPDFPRLTVARAPKRIGKEKLPSEVMSKWLLSMYYRYWNMRTERFNHKAAQLPKPATVAITEGIEL